MQMQIQHSSKLSAHAQVWYNPQPAGSVAQELPRCQPHCCTSPTLCRARFLMPAPVVLLQVLRQGRQQARMLPLQR